MEHYSTESFSTYVNSISGNYTLSLPVHICIMYLWLHNFNYTNLQLGVIDITKPQVHDTYMRDYI